MVGVISSFGGPRAADAYDFEGTRWVTLFTGEYRLAKVILARLEEENIPNRLTFPGRPETGPKSASTVDIEVMKKNLSTAKDRALRPVLEE